MGSRTIDEEIAEKYKRYSEAEKMCMGYGAEAVWGIIAPKKLGYPGRRVWNRHFKAINLLRDMFHSLPNRGKHIRRGRLVLAANLLFRDGVGR